MWNFRAKVPMVFLEDSKILRNKIGISTLHYDRLVLLSPLLRRCVWGSLVWRGVQPFLPWAWGGRRRPHKELWFKLVPGGSRASSGP